MIENLPYLFASILIFKGVIVLFIYTLYRVDLFGRVVSLFGLENSEIMLYTLLVFLSFLYIFYFSLSLKIDDYVKIYPIPQEEILFFVNK